MRGESFIAPDPCHLRLSIKRHHYPQPAPYGGVQSGEKTGHSPSDSSCDTLGASGAGSAGASGRGCPGAGAAGPPGRWSSRCRVMAGREAVEKAHCMHE